METMITATTLANNLSDVLDRVKERGERFVVEQNGERVATIIPVPPQRGPTLGEFRALLRDLPPPDEAFAGDVAALRAALTPPEIPEWPS